jgi:hypothetical protein
MKTKNYKMQYTINKPISSVWEEMHALTGYSDYKVSNIHKKNEDTWYFEFFFFKNRFSKILASSIKGKAYSKDDRLTSIEIKYESTASTIYTLVAYMGIVSMNNFIRDSILKWTAIVLLMLCISLGYSYIYNKESNVNLYEFVKKLNLEDTSKQK